MSEITLSGYDTDKKLAAQQVTRGGKTVYIVSLPLNLIPILLPIPDPLKPYEGNRAVRKGHAYEFGLYWLGHADSWTVPPLLVDTSDSLLFEEFATINEGAGGRLGKVILPNYSSKILNILDGQHRILGWNMIQAKLMQDLKDTQELLLNFKRSGTDLDIQNTEKKLKGIRADIARMEREQVTLEIITGVTSSEHKTFFTTIADKAEGINPSERTRLDEVNMTSRVAKELSVKVPLLQGRVDMRKGSVSKKSGNLMSLANVKDIVRHTSFGIKGKVTLAREKEFVDSNAFEIAEHFINAVVESVPKMREIELGTYTPNRLREDSLMGSITVWRCLAGAYHELAVKVIDNRLLEWNGDGHKQFVSMLSDAHKKMRISTEAGEKVLQNKKNWEATGCLNPSGVSLLSRSQDLKNLAALFAAWAKSGTLFEPNRIGK